MKKSVSTGVSFSTGGGSVVNSLHDKTALGDCFLFLTSLFFFFLHTFIPKSTTMTLSTSSLLVVFLFLVSVVQIAGFVYRGFAGLGARAMRRWKGIQNAKNIRNFGLVVPLLSLLGFDSLRHFGFNVVIKLIVVLWVSLDATTRVLQKLDINGEDVPLSYGPMARFSRERSSALAVDGNLTSSVCCRVRMKRSCRRVKHGVSGFHLQSSSRCCIRSQYDFRDDGHGHHYLARTQFERV